MNQTDKDQAVSVAQASVNAAQATLDAVNALAVDPDVNPLQAQLDAANAQVATLTGANAALQAKIAAAKAAAQADRDADAANVAGQGVLDALA